MGPALAFPNLLREGAGAVGFQLRQMLFGPAAEALERHDQGAAERGERVFDFRDGAVMDLSAHETVALQAAQGLGKHLL